MKFKIKKSRPLFTLIFSKNGNFKTQDFSPLIKRVVAGVGEHQCRDSHMSIKTSFGKFGKLLMAKKAKKNNKKLLSFEH